MNTSQMFLLSVIKFSLIIGKQDCKTCEVWLFSSNHSPRFSFTLPGVFYCLLEQADEPWNALEIFQICVMMKSCNVRFIFLEYNSIVLTERMIHWH